jgi:hypothetical protein
MAVSKIDWTIMWKLYRYQFFWIYLSIGVPLRFLLARGFKPVLAGITSLYVAVSSSASSFLCIWFPIVPLICGAVLILVAGHAAGESLLITVPLVALSMGIETAFVDALLFRLFLKRLVERPVATFLTTNTLNAAIALALALAWVFHHPVQVIAASDRFR